MDFPADLFNGAFVAIASGACAFIASYSATRVTLKYMERDIKRAQSTADNAHRRIDAYHLNQIPGGKRDYDPPEEPTLML